ncbi:MAG: PAS domain S-box protein [Candidatus Atribacteria bacterium]|nr:MAG: PAS domain S-box protein [Candidatus Atribacteria bacterium]
MKGIEKTKEQLIDELAILRQQITELQKSEIKHRQIEESLRDSEEKFRILVEMATDTIFLETTEDRILECNTVAAKMFGYTKEEIIGWSLAAVLPHLPVRPSWCLTSGLTSLAPKGGLKSKFLSMSRLTDRAKYGMEMAPGLKRLCWMFVISIRFREICFPGQYWKIEMSRYRWKTLWRICK